MDEFWPWISLRSIRDGVIGTCPPLSPSLARCGIVSNALHGKRAGGCLGGAVLESRGVSSQQSRYTSGEGRSRVMITVAAVSPPQATTHLTRMNDCCVCIVIPFPRRATFFMKDLLEEERKLTLIVDKRKPSDKRGKSLERKGST